MSPARAAQISSGAANEFALFSCSAPSKSGTCTFSKRKSGDRDGDGYVTESTPAVSSCFTINDPQRSTALAMLCSIMRRFVSRESRHLRIRRGRGRFSGSRRGRSLSEFELRSFMRILSRGNTVFEYDTLSVVLSVICPSLSFYLYDSLYDSYVQR